MTDQVRVLIVDEDPDSRVAARKAAQRAGLPVAAETGYGTQAMSLATDSLPEVILVAIEEPVARPFETAEALANLLPTTPIVIYSSLSDAESVRRGMVFGARDYLTKPLDAARLKEAVHRALERQERRQQKQAAGPAGLQARGSVITIAGAKGGIGKTVVSVNLGLSLRRASGKTVVIVDADTQFGDVATMLDVTPGVTAAELVRNASSVDRDRIRDFVSSAPGDIGIIATAEEDPWERLAPDDFKRLIDVLAQVYEFVVIDTSGSFDRFTRTCVEASTLTLLVTSGEVSSIRDTAAAVRRLGQWGIEADRVRLIVNRTGRDADVALKELAASIGREVFFEVPFDRAVPRSVQLGQPIALQQGPMAATFGRLAQLISGARQAARPHAQGVPFFKRLLTIRGRSYDPAMAPVPEHTDGQR